MFTYVVMACADVLAAATEIDEATNCVSSSFFRVVRADLVVTTLTATPESLSPGGKLTATVRLRNQGDLPAVASHTRFFLGSAATRNQTDVRFASLLAFGTLAPAQNASAKLTLTVPNVAPGTYFLLACADDTKRNRRQPRSATKLAR